MIFHLLWPPPPYTPLMLYPASNAISHSSRWYPPRISCQQCHPSLLQMISTEKIYYILVMLERVSILIMMGNLFFLYKHVRIYKWKQNYFQHKLFLWPSIVLLFRQSFKVPWKLLKRSLVLSWFVRVSGSYLNKSKHTCVMKFMILRFF